MTPPVPPLQQQLNHLPPQHMSLPPQPFSLPPPVNVIGKLIVEGKFDFESVSAYYHVRSCVQALSVE